MPRYTTQIIGGDEFIEPREVPGKGLCALQRMLFTVGLVYGITEGGKVGRYCYALEDVGAAYVALLTWDGVGHPSGPWIKHKTHGVDEPNPDRYKHRNQGNVSDADEYR